MREIRDTLAAPAATGPNATPPIRRVHDPKKTPFTWATRPAARGLLTGLITAAVLIGCTRIVPFSVAAGPGFVAPAPTSQLDAMSMRSLEGSHAILEDRAGSLEAQKASSLLQFEAASRASSEPALMPAAVPTGAFEELQAPTPQPTPPNPDRRVQEPATPTSAPPAEPKESLLESGIASTYGEGDGFQGNLTACGQVFDTYVPQIAHKSLPCGTMVRVEDTDTGRSVVAEVTDRGPYVRGRVVDLSWGAFRQLDPHGPGLVHVNVYVVDH